MPGNQGYRGPNGSPGTYNAETGQFTCRVPGVYYFAFQVISSGNLCLSLIRNERKELGVCDSNSRGILQVNSGSGVLQLAKNDQVWLESDPRQGNRVYDGTEADSVFSGFLLFPENQ
uniref:Complement C1q A chain n=1 Tax=Chelonoidis abingdonii TaxID=106734 RepID=A0A8C0IUC3_CHEAB